VARTFIEGGDDFQRIRAIGADLEQRLKSEGVDSFEHIAGWTADDVKRIGQLLGIPGRIDREQWIEQAQILAKGGETYYSRNRLAALKAATPAPETAADQIAERTSFVSQTPDTADEPEAAAESPEEANFQTASESEEEAAAESEDEAGKEPIDDEPVDVAAPDVIEEPPLEAKSPVESAAPSNLSGVLAASHGRSVAEMAAAAAAAIAAASASVTRGLKPIEPISPLSRVDPKISMPAKLSDAIKEKVAASASAQPQDDVEPPRPLAASSHGPQDDLKRIRGVGVLIEKRLNAMGISRYEQIANWTSGEIDRVSQVLEFKGRIEREGWVEQARILLNGGQTEFSRRVDRGEVDTSRET
jgi:predicted flap endonuclease-1-like 5' DNA nuclease